jgi:hypothetical protein
VADTSYAAMPCTHAAAMSPTHTRCTNAGSYSATSSASAGTAPTAATATASTASREQRSRCCDQQCRYGGYCKQLGYLRHDDLLFAFNSAANPRQYYGARQCLKVELSTECSAQNLLE